MSRILVYRAEAFVLMPSCRYDWNFISGQGNVLVGGNYSGFTDEGTAKKVAIAYRRQTRSAVRVVRRPFVAKGLDYRRQLTGKLVAGTKWKQVWRWNADDGNASHLRRE